MGERPDQVGRDPLAGETGGDPASGAFEPDAVTPDPALGDEASSVDEVDEVEVTRIEIERTRAGMGETVDAIQERLSPDNLKEQAKDRVREATVGKAQEAGSGIVDTVRQNPLPAALTGIGLGWLFMNARRSNSELARYRADRRYGYDYGYPPVDAYPTGYKDERGTRLSPGEAIGRTRDRVGETATQAQDRAGEVAGRAQDRVSNLGEQARYRAQRASGGFQRMLRENPLAMGALAVGTGAAVGLAIPQTTKEHEVMGEARDNFVESAQEKAQDVQQKVQQVAEEAQSAAKDEAENQGLTQQ